MVHSIWEPPSGEIESLLFALQAAIGAGFIGYFIGYTRGKSKQKEEEENKTMLLIDKYAYINGLKHVHPVEKMTIALFLLLFTLIVKDKTCFTHHLYGDEYFYYFCGKNSIFILSKITITTEFFSFIRNSYHPIFVR